MTFASDLFRPDTDVPEIARNVLDWVIDLETTTAKQGRGNLCRDNKYCCLGRGCEVLGIERTEDADGTVRYGGGRSVLTGEATAILGLLTRSGRFSPPVIDGGWRAGALTGLNDTFEWSFPRIAAFIRGSWERQFSKPLEESL